MIVRSFSLPSMALGIVFLSIRDMQAYTMPMHDLGFRYFYIVLWTLWPHLGSRDDMPSGWLFACGMLFLQAGQLAGSFTVQLRCVEIGQQHDLSKREIEIFVLLAQGYNRPQICETLVIGDETVKTHIKHIYQKLSVHTRKDLVQLVARERDEGFG